MKILQTALNPKQTNRRKYVFIPLAHTNNYAFKWHLKDEYREAGSGLLRPLMEEESITNWVTKIHVLDIMT